VLLGRTRSVCLVGLSGYVVDVEAHLAPSLPAFTLVGLPDTALAEARDRVRAAVTSSGLAWPNRRITVNLSPAALPKAGSAFDVAIAVAILAGAGLVAPDAASAAVHLGELGLDGRLRPVRGVLPAVAAAVAAGLPRVVVPAANAAEARLVPGADVVGVHSLAEIAARYGADVDVPAVTAGDYVSVRRAFAAGDVVELTLPTAPRVSWPDPRIDAVRGCVVVERGPEVLCLESVDLATASDGRWTDVGDVRLDATVPPREVDGRVSVRVHAGHAAEQPWPYGDTPAEARPDTFDVPLVPYHDWAERGPSTMRVWLPVD